MTEQEKETGSFGDGCALVICSLLGGFTGLVEATVLADKLDAEYMTSHGGDDGGATAIGSSLAVGVPFGLIAGLVVGLVLIRLLKWLDKMVQKKRRKST